jgi:hypothetical protein
MEQKPRYQFLLNMPTTLLVTPVEPKRQSMGRRSRRAAPLRRISVRLPSEVVTVDLTPRESLRDRLAAKVLMRNLRPKIRELITSRAQTADAFRPPPPPGRFRSLDHIPILELEQMDRVITDEVVSCVSFISGTLFDDFAPTPD